MGPWGSSGRVPRRESPAEDTRARAAAHPRSEEAPALRARGLGAGRRGSAPDLGHGNDLNTDAPALLVRFDEKVHLQAGRQQARRDASNAVHVKEQISLEAAGHDKAPILLERANDALQLLAGACPILRRVQGHHDERGRSPSSVRAHLEGDSGPRRDAFGATLQVVPVAEQVTLEVLGSDHETPVVLPRPDLPLQLEAGQPSEPRLQRPHRGLLRRQRRRRP
mmetsp:Transcript_44319/g.118506  ORF Transcript_44319/g.118506 Transcript_44319/m.118506 type:complete len:223 (+) Transcript_44319:27-695(+)